MKLTIGHLYPELLNLYGDRGNIQCLRKRLEWRGIEAEVREYQLTDPIDFSNLDVILLGGGSDREQQLVCKQLQTIQKDFKAYVEDGGVTLAICGGYQLLGHYYDTDDGRIDGLSLVDLWTKQGSPRLITNIVIKNDMLTDHIVGFENHGGRTYLGEGISALGEVKFGFGNNGEDGKEGVLYKNVLGTYLHGPLLPKNPQVCDYLLSRAMDRRFGVSELAPLDDTQEREANEYIVKRFCKA